MAFDDHQPGNDRISAHEGTERDVESNNLADENNDAPLIEDETTDGERGTPDRLSNDRDSQEEFLGHLETQESATPGESLHDAGEAPVEDGGNSVSMGFLEIIYGVVAEPKATFRYLGNARPFLHALFFMVILTVFNLLTGMGELKKLGSSLPFASGNFFVPVLILIICFAFLGWFVDAATVSLFSQLLGGTGNGIGLLASFSFASVPLLLAAILEFGLSAAGAGDFLTGVISLAGLIWSLVLQIWAVREIEGLSTGRSVLAYFAFPILIVIIVLMVLILMVMSLGPLLEYFSSMTP